MSYKRDSWLVNRKDTFIGLISSLNIGKKASSPQKLLDFRIAVRIPLNVHPGYINQWLIVVPSITKLLSWIATPSFAPSQPKTLRLTLQISEAVPQWSAGCKNLRVRAPGLASQPSQPPHTLHLVVSQSSIKKLARETVLGVDIGMESLRAYEE